MKIRAAAAAAAVLLVSFLPSCSVISVNIDKIFPPESVTFSDDSGAVADTDPQDMRTDTETGPSDERDDAPETHEYTGQRTAEENLESIGDYDFAGNTVFIRATDEKYAKNFTASFDSDSLDAYSEALYRRTRMVEEKFHCTVRYSVSNESEIVSELKSAIGNEEYYADLFLIPGDTIVTLANKGLLYNLRSLPFLDFDADYFTAGSFDALSAGYYTYGVASMATVDPESIGCVYINCEKSERDYKKAVNDGEWCWGMLLSDCGGDVVCEMEDEKLADLVAASAGLRFVDSSGSVPKVILPDGIEDAASAARRLISVIRDRGNASLNDFISGGDMFYIGTLGDMDHMAATEFEWLTLPMPKLSAEQERYLSCMPEDTPFLAVPVNTVNPTGASVLIRAFAGASDVFLRDAYVQYRMYGSVRSGKTLSLIETVFETPYYEFTRCLGGDNENILKATTELFYQLIEDEEMNVEKQFSKREDKANSAMEKLYAPRNK